MDQSWRAGFPDDSRSTIVSRIMDTLQRLTSRSGRDGGDEIWKIAKKFEEKIFYAASDQIDYVRKVSQGMKNLEARAQNAPNNTLATNETDQQPARLLMDSGSATQVQSQQQVAHQLTSAGMLNNGVQGFAGGLASSLSSASNVAQPAPLMNVHVPVSDNLRALNGGSVSNIASSGQASSRDFHSQSGLLAANQKRIALSQQASQQQQQQHQPKLQQQQQQEQRQQPPSDQQQAQQNLSPGHVQHVPAAQATQLGVSILQQEQPPLSNHQELQQLPPGSQQQQQQTHQQSQPHLRYQQVIQQHAFMNKDQSLEQQCFQPLQQQKFQARASPGDSLKQGSQAGGIIQSEIVWSKMQELKGKYLQDMRDLYAIFTMRSRQPMPQEQFLKLRHYKIVLERMMPYLNAPKDGIPKEFTQDKAETLEKQIVSIIEMFKRHKQLPQQMQQPQRNLGHLQAGQQPQQPLQVLPPERMPVQQQQTPHMNSETNAQATPLETGGDSRLAKTMMLMKQTHLNSHTFLQQQQPGKGPPLQATSSSPMSAASQLSPQSDMMNALSLVPKVGTSSQASTPPCMVPSLSPMTDDLDSRPLTAAAPKVPLAVNGQVSVSTSSGPSAAIGTSDLSASPRLGNCTASLQILNHKACLLRPEEDNQIATEGPISRLARAIETMSPEVFMSAVNDINLLCNLSDNLSGSASGSQSMAAVGEDLALATKCHTRARALSSLDGCGITKKVKRRVESLALSWVSFDGSVVNSMQKPGAVDSEMKISIPSRIKRSRLDKNLNEEIDRINAGLIETQVEVDLQGCERVLADGKEGIVVSCVYNAIAMKPNTTLHSSLFYKAVPPLQLLVPPQYPDCSPIVLEDDAVSNASDSLSHQTWDAFKRAVQGLPQPVLLGDMVAAWDSSAYNAVVKAAVRQGGGCFSSTYGTWDYFINA